jgi:hypothetical protein
VQARRTNRRDEADHVFYGKMLPRDPRKLKKVQVHIVFRKRTMLCIQQTVLMLVLAAGHLGEADDAFRETDTHKVRPEINQDAFVADSTVMRP